MSFTTRRPFHRSPRCAVTASILILSLCASFSANFAVAADDIGLAENGFYYQAGSGIQQGQFTGAFNANTFLGAERFYNAGYTGTNAVMANIEAGYIWNGHETLSHAQMIPNIYGAAGEVDRHATLVGMVMGGRTGGANPGPYQRGMAPDAQLFSGGIATSWPNNNSSFPRFTTSFFVNFSGISTFGPYRAAFINGLSGNRSADVINMSWVGRNDTESLTGNDTLTGTLDALAYENPRTMLVTAAGNTLPTGIGPNRVPSAASGFNDLTVAALAPNGGAYNIASVFSNGGPNDYSDPINGLISTAHQVIDIAAPGENVAAAYYGGETGGNGPTVFGPTNGIPGGPNWYSRNVNGTSFAAPTVTGGAALLYDAAYSLFANNPDARDTRVMKAVLMNAADKTLNWNNGQVAHPNGNGGVLTTQSLDSRVGVGRLNLDRAFDQFLSGTTDVAGVDQTNSGTVKSTGWDYAVVAGDDTNDYIFDKPLRGGSIFTATLDWFRQRQTFGVASYQDVSFDNLDLELWTAAAGSPLALISESKSTYNNVEHFSFAIPTTGDYLLRVRPTGQIFDIFNQAGGDTYGLAWSGTSVPEPITIALLALALPAILLPRRRQP